MTMTPDYFIATAMISEEFFCEHCENDVELEFEVEFDTRTPIDSAICIADVDCPTCGQVIFEALEKMGGWII